MSTKEQPRLQLPCLALAPMQDVTDLPFWRLMARYGGADLYFTEYFRVYPNSQLEKHILRSITENPTGKPVIAQMIGNDIDSLVRSARELMKHPVRGIDLNLGCPAPVVYRKCAGGGLLREPGRIDALLGALREAIAPPFTFSVKTRVGFDSGARFEELLGIFARHSIDLLTVHGRTVKQMYRGGVDLQLIAQAAQRLCCPVLANGNVTTVADAHETLARTGASGLMIGRGAIRNPWLFGQIRDSLRGEAPFQPTGRDLLNYIHELYEATTPPGLNERVAIQKLKKYMNFIGAGIEPSGRFLHTVRRLDSKQAFFELCREFLGHDQPMELRPFATQVPG